MLANCEWYSIRARHTHTHTYTYIHTYKHTPSNESTRITHYEWLCSWKGTPFILSSAISLSLDLWYIAAYIHGSRSYYRSTRRMHLLVYSDDSWFWPSNTLISYNIIIMCFPARKIYRHCSDFLARFSHSMFDVELENIFDKWKVAEQNLLAIVWTSTIQPTDRTITCCN